MTPVECAFEPEVLSAALQSRWPAQVDPLLRAHVAGCAICSDVLAVAAAMEEGRQDLRACAMIPDSGRVWWGAQLRARREAAKSAGRPITAAQVIAFACAMGLLGACFGATSVWFQSALRWAASNVAGLDVKGIFSFAMLAGHGALVAGVGAVVLLVPAALYLAMGRD